MMKSLSLSNIFSHTIVVNGLLHICSHDTTIPIEFYTAIWERPTGFLVLFEKKLFHKKK